jgi:hypothetical protein
MYLKLTSCELPEVDTAATGKRDGDGGAGGAGGGGGDGEGHTDFGMFHIVG